MNYKNLSYAVLIAAVLGVGAARAEMAVTTPQNQPNQVNTAPDDTTTNVTTSQAGLPQPTQITVSEDILSFFAGDAQHHLLEARDEIVQRDYKSAAKELRKVASLVKLEALRAVPEMRSGLTASSREIMRLADDVETGQTIDAQLFNESFARVELALARHHDLKAKQFWGANNAIRAGRELNAALSYLQSGVIWTGQRLEPTDLTALRTATDLSQNMMLGSSLMKERVDRDMGTASGLIARHTSRTLQALTLPDVEPE